MSRAVLAVFDTPSALAEAARTAKDECYVVADAFTPFPVEGFEDETAPTAAIGWAAGIGGLTVATAMFCLQAWSAAYGYPIDAGGRPLFSWPTFFLAAFEIGVLAAAISALVAFLVTAGLPRLHHPVFDIEGFERASQDRCLLAVTTPGGERRDDLMALLDRAGAVEVREVEL